MLSANQNEINLDQIFIVIWNSCNNLLPANWQQATLTAEIEDDESGLTYGRYCLTDAPNQWQSFDNDYTHYVMLDALRQRVDLLVGNKWHKAIITMTPVGAVSAFFEYQ